jgi:hypothetical protein
MHKYYHSNFFANKQNRDAHAREVGESAVFGPGQGVTEAQVVTDYLCRIE